MARMTTIIDDFSVGEVSPLTEAKISSEEFKDGLREATNVVPDPHGPLIGRPGFERLLEIAGVVGKSVTLFTLPYSPEVYFLILFFDDKLRIYDQALNLIKSIDATPYDDMILHGPDGEDHLLAAEVAPSGLELVLTCADVYPYHIVMVNTPPWTATFEEIVFGNKDDPEYPVATPQPPPSPGTESSRPTQWDVEGNRPTSMTVYQNRTFWGGCRDEPDTFWGSRTFHPYNMSLQTPMPGSTAAEPVYTVLDTDGIEFQISKHGRIRWIKAGRNLLLGTENAEHIVTNESGIITPNDIKVELQSAHGSNRVPSALIGNEVVYVTSDGLKLRSMWWKWIEAGWISMDATFTAEHMTRSGVSQLTFARNPNSNIWLKLRNGDLIACTYRREEAKDPIVGWFRANSDAMFFHSISAVEDHGTAFLYAVVCDKEAEAPHRFQLVRYVPHDYLDTTRVFLDGYATVAGPTSKPDFSGMFFDSSIAVVADGFHIPDVTLNPDGTIDLPFEAQNEVHAGYPYVQKAVLLPLIYKSSEGSVGHQMKRWNKVFLRILQSYRPKVNGTRPPERNVTTLDDTAEPYLDAAVQISPMLGWDRGGVLTIEQDLPFQIVVNGVYGEVGIESI